MNMAIRRGREAVRFCLTRGLMAAGLYHNGTGGYLWHDAKTGLWLDIPLEGRAKITSARP